MIPNAYWISNNYGTVFPYENGNKQEVFARYKKDYYKAKKTKGGRKTRTAIIDTVKSVTRMGRKSIIRAFNRLQKKDSRAEERRGRPRYYIPTLPQL